MKKPLSLIILFCFSLTYAQCIGLITGITRYTISPNIFGLNGRSTEGPSWGDALFTSFINQINPTYVRYPGGTIGNYWDWHTGNYVAGSGKFSNYPATIPTFISGIPQNTEIIYMVNMVRPTPTTGVSLTATNLDSEEVLNLKINDIINALKEFEKYGKLPKIVELGNELYFTNEHAGVYAGNVELYLNHAKKIGKAIKTQYPRIELLLCTTKGGYKTRDKWNAAVFTALNNDSEFAGYIRGVVQHHYLDEKFGTVSIVNNNTTAQEAIAEAFDYTSQAMSDYNLVPNNLKLWITEFGVTKPNADDTWVTGLRAAAMMMGWINLGEKIEHICYHHITDDPNFLNKSSYQAGPAAVAYSLINEAHGQSSSFQKIEFSDNPNVTSMVKALHGYKFIGKDKESLFILNISAQAFTKVSLDNLIPTNSNTTLVQRWSEEPYQTNFEESVLNKVNSMNERTIDIKPFSITTISIKQRTASSIVNNRENEVKIFPQTLNQSIEVSVPTELLEATLTIYNINGETIHKEKLSSTTSTINLKEVTAGFYFANIRKGSFSKQIKLIKNN